MAGRLQVVGERLEYAGEEVWLRGVATGDPVLGRAGRPASDYQEIAQVWGANTVRFGIHPGIWMDNDPAIVLDRLADEADAALSEGLFVIIDWHAIGWPDGPFLEAPGLAANTYDSTFDLAMGFWDQVAYMFGDEGRVLFELWNEPAAIDPEWDEEPAWEALKPFWEQLLGVIRQHGDNVVIASSGNYTYDLRGVRRSPLRGGNVAYAWHVYAGHSNNDPRLWAQMLDDVQTVAPVVVTEWGFQRGAQAHFNGTSEGFGNPFVYEFLEGRALHSTAWCWHPVWGPPMVEDDWRTPNEFGHFVQRYLRGV